MAHLEAFQSMGFEIDPIGERTYAIRSTPSFAYRRDPKEMVKEILDELSFIKREGKGAEAIQTMLVTLACHSAVRGNFALRREEMGELVESLYAFHTSTTCPHGRPIFFIIPPEELAKQFKRGRK
jgi:DNA mismatch repair protein MutL